MKSRQGETGVSKGHLAILEHTHNSYNCNCDPETEAAFPSLKKHAQSRQHSLSEKVLARLSTSVGNWCYTFDSRSKNLLVFVFFLHNDMRNWLILRRNSLVIVDVKLILMRMDKRVVISGTRLILMFVSGRKLRFF